MTNPDVWRYALEKPPAEKFFSPPQGFSNPTLASFNNNDSIESPAIHSSTTMINLDPLDTSDHPSPRENWNRRRFLGALGAAVGLGILDIFDRQAPPQQPLSPGIQVPPEIREVSIYPPTPEEIWDYTAPASLRNLSISAFNGYPASWKNLPDREAGIIDMFTYLHEQLNPEGTKNANFAKQLNRGNVTILIEDACYPDPFQTETWNTSGPALLPVNNKPFFPELHEYVKVFTEPQTTNDLDGPENVRPEDAEIRNIAAEARKKEAAKNIHKFLEALNKAKIEASQKKTD